MDPAAMHRMMMSDKSATSGVNLTPGLVRRVWHFAHAYRSRVFGFLVIVIIESILGLAPPLVIKQILDHAIPNKDKALMTALALVMIAVAFANAALSMVERWLSATV